MNNDQFNELLAYTKIVAVNTAGIFQQNQRMRSLTAEEIQELQRDLVQTAGELQHGAKPFDWPPPAGRAEPPLDVS